MERLSPAAKDFSKEFPVSVVLLDKTRPMAEQGEEQDWIRRSRNGDAEAFGSLVQRYKRMIDALTYRMTGSLADAEDLAQETFIQAYRQLERFRGEAGFSSWLYRIAVNACLNWQKAKGRRERMHFQWTAEQRREQDASTAAEAGGTNLLTQHLQNALMTLPAKQRAVVVLTVYDELSHAEAARVLGCSETTISWRLFVARRKLKRLLAKRKDARQSGEP